jgi:hypothetical protein
MASSCNKHLLDASLSRSEHNPATLPPFASMNCSEDRAPEVYTESSEDTEDTARTEDTESIGSFNRTTMTVPARRAEHA